VAKEVAQVVVVAAEVTMVAAGTAEVTPVAVETRASAGWAVVGWAVARMVVAAKEVRAGRVMAKLEGLRVVLMVGRVVGSLEMDMDKWVEPVAARKVTDATVKATVAEKGSKVATAAATAMVAEVADEEEMAGAEVASAPDIRMNTSPKV
jgi:hypothetical protein